MELETPNARWQMACRFDGVSTLCDEVFSQGRTSQDIYTNADTVSLIDIGKYSLV